PREKQAPPLDFFPRSEVFSQFFGPLLDVDLPARCGHRHSDHDDGSRDDNASGEVQGVEQRSDGGHPQSFRPFGTEIRRRVGPPRIPSRPPSGERAASSTESDRGEVRRLPTDAGMLPRGSALPTRVATGTPEPENAPYSAAARHRWYHAPPPSVNGTPTVSPFAFPVRARAPGRTPDPTPAFVRKPVPDTLRGRPERTFHLPTPSEEQTHISDAPTAL